MTDPGGAPHASGPPTLNTSDGEQLLGSVRRALALEYDVERELGRGGMAVVFKARDKELDRSVALKVLPPELAPVATVADRFKREARLAASLDHPNIIPVYRVGQTGGVLYMAMKFIDGRSLDAVVAEHGALPLAVTITVLRAAARALAHAHEHGIVHRDIKGANILIDRDGRIVVSDFGIARAIESSTLTATGVVIGTPHFMSPEQCAGKPAGPQSDQYSLGIVAYQLLTGSVPFDGDSLPEILQHHWFTPPPDVSLVRPDTPAALTAALLRLLAKDPAQRFASTTDLVTALESIPFPAADRAAGEAALRALVGAGVAQPVAQPVAPAQPPAATRPLASPVTATAVLAVTPTPGNAAPRRPAPVTVRQAAVPVPPVSAPSTAPSRSGPPSAAAPTTRQTAAPRPAMAAARGGRPRTTRRWRLLLGVPSLLAVLALAAAVGARRVTMPNLGTTAPTGAATRIDAPTMRDAGARAYRAHDYELARRFFVRALTLDPSDAQVREHLGCTLLKLGRADSARAVFTQASTPAHCS